MTSRPCRIEWSDGIYGLATITDYDTACDLILAVYPHAVIESDNGDVDEILAWRDAQTAGLPDSAVAVIVFIQEDPC